MKRNFKEWLSTFKDSIFTYDYYVNFEKVYANIDDIKIELNILNSLLGSKDIENEFKSILIKYPEVLKCIPILLAVRKNSILITDTNGDDKFSFSKQNHTVEEYATFAKETGLLDLMQNRLISNLVDYVTGVEVGLDSNGRKNRSGKIMESLLEDFLKATGVEYYKQMNATMVESKWGLDLSSISNDGKTQKRFDFVVKTPARIFGIETNFYSGGGSKLNETARSYKNIAIESQNIPGFSFMWITDGIGWHSARHNLEETFDVMEHIYCINDLANNVLSEIFRR